jgi:hypothetical protein
MLECKEEDAPKVAQILEETMLKASQKFCTRLDIPAESHITKVWTK